MVLWKQGERVSYRLICENRAGRGLEMLFRKEDLSDREWIENPPAYYGERIENPLAYYQD